MIHVILINPCTDITSKCMWIYLDDLWLTALRMNLKEIKEFGNERMNVYERGCVLQCKDRQAVGSYSWMSNKDAWSFSFRCRKKKNILHDIAFTHLRNRFQHGKIPLDAHTIPLVKSIVIWPLPLLNKLCSEPWPHGSR